MLFALAIAFHFSFISFDNRCLEPVVQSIPLAAIDLSVYDTFSNYMPMDYGYNEPMEVLPKVVTTSADILTIIARLIIVVSGAIFGVKRALEKK